MPRVRRHSPRYVPSTKPCAKCGTAFEKEKSTQTLCYGCGEATRITQTVAKRPRTKPARTIYATDFLLNLPAMRAELARQVAAGQPITVPSRDATDLTANLSTCKRPIRRTA